MPKKTPTSVLSKSAFTRPQASAASLTPQPSSDPAGPEPSSPIRNVEGSGSSGGKNKENGLLGPGSCSVGAEANRGVVEVAGVGFGSPARKVCDVTLCLLHDGVVS